MTSTIYDDWKIHLSETADSNDCKQFENNHFIKDWPIYVLLTIGKEQFIHG